MVSASNDSSYPCLDAFVERVLPSPEVTAVLALVTIAPSAPSESAMRRPPGAPTHLADEEIAAESQEGIATISAYLAEIEGKENAVENAVAMLAASLMPSDLKGILAECLDPQTSAEDYIQFHEDRELLEMVAQVVLFRIFVPDKDKFQKLVAKLQARLWR